MIDERTETFYILKLVDNRGFESYLKWKRGIELAVTGNIDEAKRFSTLQEAMETIDSMEERQRGIQDKYKVDMEVLKIDKTTKIEKIPR